MPRTRGRTRTSACGSRFETDSDRYDPLPVTSALITERVSFRHNLVHLGPCGLGRTTQVQRLLQGTSSGKDRGASPPPGDRKIRLRYPGRGLGFRLLFPAKRKRKVGSMDRTSQRQGFVPGQKRQRPEHHRSDHGHCSFRFLTRTLHQPRPATPHGWSDRDR